MATLKAVTFALLLVNIQLGIGASNKIDEIAKDSYAKINKACELGLIKRQGADEVISQIHEASTHNKLALIQEVSRLLNEAVDKGRIDTMTKVKILANGVNENLHKDLAASPLTALGTYVDAAAKKGILSENDAAGCKSDAQAAKRTNTNPCSHVDIEGAAKA